MEHSNVGVGEMVDILATLESEKWWSLRNIGVGEMVESEKHWSRRNGEHFSNVGVGDMVDCRRSRRNGET